MRILFIPESYNKLALHVHFAKNESIPMPSCLKKKKKAFCTKKHEDFGKTFDVSLWSGFMCMPFLVWVLRIMLNYLS